MERRFDSAAKHQTTEATATRTNLEMSADYRSHCHCHHYHYRCHYLDLLLAGKDSKPDDHHDAGNDFRQTQAEASSHQAIPTSQAGEVANGSRPRSQSRIGCCEWSGWRTNGLGC